MIYYFSGLGNTRYVANSLSKKIGEKIKFIPETEPKEEEAIGDSIGFLFPIYSWGLPENVLKFINQLSDKFWKDVRLKKLPVWMVCTCGDETGNAPAILEKLLKTKGVTLVGEWSVIMPNTYVLLPGFDIDSKDLESKKLSHAIARVNEIADKIGNKEWTKDIHKGTFPATRTKIIYPLFLKKGINPKKWNHTNACVKCGKCVRSCSENNIMMGENGPEWGNRCISCLACYHHCPYHAVEYGKITKNKGQYVCPL